MPTATVALSWSRAKWVARTHLAVASATMDSARSGGRSRWATDAGAARRRGSRVRCEDADDDHERWAPDDTDRRRRVFDDSVREVPLGQATPSSAATDSAGTSFCGQSESCAPPAPAYSARIARRPLARSTIGAPTAGARRMKGAEPAAVEISALTPLPSEEASRGRPVAGNSNLAESARSAASTAASRLQTAGPRSPHSTAASRAPGAAVIYRHLSDGRR
jgi:hypothetical protein